MWARIIELMLGCWLAVSPFVFRYSAEDRMPWFSDLISAAVVVGLALVSYWPPLRYAHVANVAVALWLIAFGFFGASYPTPPSHQNSIVIGILLLMFAIIPNHANRPPRPWRNFLAREHDRTTVV